MSKRGGFFKRASQKLGITKRELGSYSKAEVAKMTPDQQLNAVAEQLPTISGVFAMFGDPRGWPTFAMYDDEEKRQVSSFYDDWKVGTFNNVPGVIAPPPAPGTVIH